MLSQAADQQTPDHVYDRAERPDWPVRRHTPRPSSVPLNAKKHGLCAKTIIIEDEDPEEFDRLHDKWRREYGNPDDNDLIAELVLQVVIADWARRRAQIWYDTLMVESFAPMVFHMTGELREQHDRTLRYKTTLDRAFHREYRMLESHYKSRLARAERAEKARKLDEEKAERKKNFAAEAEKALPPTNPSEIRPAREVGASCPLVRAANPANPKDERILPNDDPPSPQDQCIPQPILLTTS